MYKDLPHELLFFSAAFIDYIYIVVIYIGIYI